MSTLGLVAEAVLGSAVGAWTALGALAVLVVMRLLSWTGVWPAEWPDFLGGD